MLPLCRAALAAPGSRKTICTSFGDTPARSRRRSSTKCPIEPLIVATLRPFSWATDLMPEAEDATTAVELPRAPVL